MTRIFDESALNIQPIPSGFIIAYKKSTSSVGGKIAVGYTLCSSDNPRLTPAGRNVYQLAKFGTKYKTIEASLPSPFYWKTLTLPGDRLLTYYPDGKAVIFNSEGEATFKGDLKKDGNGASEYIFTGENIWCVYPFSKTVERKNSQNFKTDLIIGGSDSGFGIPCSLFYSNSFLYVSDKEKCVIWRVNTETYEVKEYLRFEEPVYQYFVIEDIAIVRLSSGIYKL